MSDETQQPNTEPVATPTETQNSEENSIPVSPSEPTANAPIPITDSAPTEVLPETLERPAGAESAIPLKDDIPANEPFDSAQGKPSEPVSEPLEKPNITVEKRGNDVTITEVMEPTASDSAEATPDKHPEPATAQMAGNEPLAQKRKENLERANLKRQTRKRERINEILDLFAARQKITNDEVEKLLHVSDATATRYLEILEKEGKIKQVGKTGKHTHYEKI